MASVKHTVASLLHHHSSKDDTSPEVISEEKHFVAQFADGPHGHLSADEIKDDPQNKQLGGSSRGLSVHDFILIKTLGTGTSAAIPEGSVEKNRLMRGCMLTYGTF